MVSWFWQWALMFLFALLIALSFTCYGVAFRGLGGPPASPLGALVGYVLRLLVNPWFLLGLALAFTGSVLRLSIFRLVGIARSALVSELSLVMMVVLACLIFGERLRFPRDYVGAALIVLGSWIVGR
jgi:drug/metabolite transporter (DMT)-like permease